MLYRLILVLFLVPLLSVSAFSSDCTFLMSNENCLRFNQDLNSFSLSLSQNDLNHLGWIEVTMYLKEHSSNVVETNVIDSTSFSIGNIIQPGTYVIEIIPYTKGGHIMELLRFEVIYDNYQPLPPLLSPGIRYSNPVQGSTNVPLLRIHENGQELTTSNSQSNFELNLNRGNFRVSSFQTRFNEISSTNLQRIILPENFELVNVLVNPTQIHTSADQTTQRTFLISGSASPSSGFVYVQGRKTPVINGNFHSFVLLNDGLNSVNIEGSSSSLTHTVELIPKNLFFKNVVMPHITGSNSIDIDIEVFSDEIVSVHNNGRYLGSFQQFDGKINLLLDSTVNFIELFGPNGAYYSQVIYRETENPMITFLSPSQLTHSSRFYFMVDSELGIKTGSINLLGETIPLNRLQREGNIYWVELRDIVSGTQTQNTIVSVSVETFSGRTSSQEKQIQITSSAFNLGPASSTSEGFTSYGTKMIFPSKGSYTINFMPSRGVAFESIFLNNIEIIDYEIFSNGRVRITLPITTETGNLTLTYIDQNRNLRSDTYIFRVLSDQKLLSLFNVGDRRGLTEHQTLLGHSKFGVKKDTVEINGVPVTWFGNFFEVILPSDQFSPATITGEKLTNEIFTDNLGGLILNSASHELNLEMFSKRGIISGNVETQATAIAHKTLFSFDGINYNRVFLAGQSPSSYSFNLPASDIQGIRTAKLFYSSGSNFQIMTIDSTKPIAILTKQDDEYFIIADGIYSNILTFESNVEVSSCNHKISSTSSCHKLSENIAQIQVFLEDTNRNNNTITLELSNAIELNELLNFPSTTAMIYFTGNEIKTTSQHSYIEGNIRSQSPVENVEARIGSNIFDCEFNDFSFACMLSGLQPGENQVQVTVTNKGGSNSSTHIIVRDIETLNVSISNIFGPNLIEFNDNLYYFGGQLFINATVSNTSSITLRTLNQILTQGTRTGEFQLAVDLEQFLQAQDEKEFSLILDAEDELGRQSTSNIFRLTYQRIQDLIINIIIN